MDQLSYFHLPQDIQCLTIEKLTRWNHLHQFLSNYPNISPIYECVTKIEPDEDITNPEKWMTLEQMSKFPNLVSMTNPLYIPKNIDGLEFIILFGELMKRLVKLEELVIIMDIEQIFMEGPTSRIPSYTQLVLDLIWIFSLSVNEDIGWVN